MVGCGEVSLSIFLLLLCFDMRAEVKAMLKQEERNASASTLVNLKPPYSLIVAVKP